MGKACEWCEKEGKLREFEVDELGVSYNICEKCIKANENGMCVTCGEPLYGELPLMGECGGCQQIRSAKLETKRSEVMSGLGLSVLRELMGSVVFTEDDYERWVTFGQSDLTPEVRRRNRKIWIKSRLVKDMGWDEDTFKNNENDIEHLLDNYTRQAFNSKNRLVVKDKDAKWSGGMSIVASSGNVMIIENE